ncbi:alpha-L-rhamnosidase C-terminal domain-containing protein [Streptomyces sp. MK37H]|nr:alpha-L-rhamnosidase C-terminal domain-containing protein [Streptomyces sp. MK37H]
MSWSRTEGELRVAVTIPPGTTALIDLPDATEPVEIGSGTHLFRTELS